MSAEPDSITLKYHPDHTGSFELARGDENGAAWARLKLTVRSNSTDHLIKDNSISLPWSDALGVFRELGSRDAQTRLNFRFRPDEQAATLLKRFAEQFKAAQAQRKSLVAQVAPEDVEKKLIERGFTKRQLREFQLRDLAHLLTLENGANFSVPGAGKTTVTFALHTLLREEGQHLIIVAPKAANQAWKDVVKDCMASDAPLNGAERFKILDGTEAQNERILESGATRFLISYDLMIRQQGLLTRHMALHPVHLVLDESHRMKAGWRSQRGAFLLSSATLPIRRDILSGTPMPQGASDIESQLDFLWPGHGLGQEVMTGTSPRDVLGDLYVRTTKSELGLAKPIREYRDVSMDAGQLALYSIVRNEFLRDYSKKVGAGLSEYDLVKARRSVMRLLQLSVNPVLALNSMANDDLTVASGIADKVLEEGHSAKMRAVADHARELAANGEKSVIWTIFTDTIHSFNSSLADLNPVFIHGGVPSGDESDPETREGKILRFHQDDECSVLIANPAAAGEGISLHTVCHNAIYADRSYVSTHYIQSIDRIHRLGLDPNQDTNIFIYRSKAPPEVGSIDMSVTRRLGEKIRNMQALLDDPDLHELALDEEEALDPIDYDIQLDDILDIISELQGTAPEADLED